MKYLQSFAFFLLLQFLIPDISAQDEGDDGSMLIVPAAERVDQYFDLLQGKRLALVVNQSSRIGNVPLPDSFLKLGFNVVKLMVPEHGYKGVADAGADIENGVVEETAMEIISLHGKNKKPASEQLENVDAIVYDLQDVGVRFYTYISTLQYLMEACAENNKELIILDRPNPNGHYVDGPVLDTSLRSFLGMQPIPVVYGMTAGEYAQMLKGEKWIEKAGQFSLIVVPCGNYSHRKFYKLPVPPSPNLKEMNAVYLYPSMGLFEGTVMSVGRGTDKPFQQWGHPIFKNKMKGSFIPMPMEGATQPPYSGKKCYGMQLFARNKEGMIRNRIELSWLIQAYNAYPEKNKFFTSGFEIHAGTRNLRKQIENKEPEAIIRASWQKDLDAFKEIRKKYLLYEDFE